MGPSGEMIDIAPFYCFLESGGMWIGSASQMRCVMSMISSKPSSWASRDACAKSSRAVSYVKGVVTAYAGVNMAGSICGAIANTFCLQAALSSALTMVLIDKHLDVFVVVGALLSKLLCASARAQYVISSA